MVVTTLARALLRRGGRECGRRRRRIWQRPDFSVSQVFPHTAHCWLDGVHSDLHMSRNNWEGAGGGGDGGGKGGASKVEAVE